MHEFRIGGKTYAKPNPADGHFGRDATDERRIRVGTVLSEIGSSFEYIYDFGDDWRHDILLEAILPVTPRKRYPVCLDGARSAPPEDVGGTGGYGHYLEALSDLKDPDHGAMLAWGGRFDPEYFPITGVNRQLREVFPSSSSASKPANRSFTRTVPLPAKERIRVGPDDKIPVPLSARDRELIVEYSFADSGLIERLRQGAERGKSQIFYFTGRVRRSDRVHCRRGESRRKEAAKEWDTLYDRVAALLDGYTQSESE